MKLSITFLAAALLLAGCERTKPEQQAPGDSTTEHSTLFDMLDNVEAGLNEAKARRAERVRRGDTLALPYQELGRYLPVSISGYVAGAVEGQNSKDKNATIATAERRYTQGEREVKVTLIDYNGSYQVLQAMTAVYNLNVIRDTDELLSRPAPGRTDRVKGLESLNKKDHTASLTQAIDNRFLLIISATGQPDLKLVEAVARQVDATKLARL